MREVPGTRVHRRHVFFVAGYDAMQVDGHHRIFLREMKRFGTVWAVRTDSPDAGPIATATGALWHIAAEGPNWRTQAIFEVLAWDDLARADMARPVASHLKGSVRAIADMAASGTIANYFRTSRRYGLFFLFTYMLLALFWGIAAVAGFAAAWLAQPHLGTAASAALGLAATLGAGLLLLRWPGRRFRLKQSLDLAEFSVDLVRGRHPQVEDRVRAFAGRLRAAEAAAAQAGVEEIIVAGHSLGAMHAVSAVAAAVEADPAFGSRVPVRILTLGSTTTKFALHPAGRRAGDFSERPLIRHVEIRQMISPAIYRRHWFDVMRLHCQCFLAGDIRAQHDFNAYVCGPLAFDVVAAHTNGLRAYMDPDGTLRPLAADASGCILPLPDSASRP